MKKKLLVVVMALTMMVGSLAGCGSSGAKGNVTTDGSTSMESHGGYDGIRECGKYA